MISKGLQEFFGVELRNESHGGESPATLAPTDVLWEWFGLAVHERDVWDRDQALTELDRLIADGVTPHRWNTSYDVHPSKAQGAHLGLARLGGLMVELGCGGKASNGSLG